MKQKIPWCNSFYCPSFKTWICLNWTCLCGHCFGYHASRYKCVSGYYHPNKQCLCKEEKFLHNDNCTLECQINYKILEFK